MGAIDRAGYIMSNHHYLGGHGDLGYRLRLFRHILSYTSPNRSANWRNFPNQYYRPKWRCFAAIDEDSILLRFTIDPKDKEQFIKDTVGYNNWRTPLPKTLFFGFDDHPENEQDLENYQTWQGSTACGWTNNLIDMDDAKLYTVYVHYSDSPSYLDYLNECQ